MKPIGDFLERFTKIARSGSEARDHVRETLNKFGISIEDTKLSIKGSTVILKLSPAKKSELFLKQAKILEELKKHSLTKHITKLI